MPYILQWKFGPHGSEEDYGDDFAQAVSDAESSIEEWWRENVRLNGAESFGDNWKEDFLEMETGLYEGRVAAENLVWPVSEEDKAQLLKMAARVLDEEQTAFAKISAMP